MMPRSLLPRTLAPALLAAMLLLGAACSGGDAPSQAPPASSAAEPEAASGQTPEPPVQAPPEGGPEAGARPAGPPPSLLFISIDTWRWDHIGVSGQGKVETPTLDELARSGVYEPEVVVPCPLTTPSHASMFTGLVPTRHRVLDCVNYTLPRPLPHLQEAFRKKGYRTAAFVSGQTLLRRFGLDRGFDVYDDSGMRKRSEDDWMGATRDGLDTTRAALEEFDGLPASQPAFLWVHYFDAHAPYRPRPAYDRRYPGKPYRAQVAFIDDQVARLIDRVRRDEGRSWRIVIVGDHGEAFGDHHEIGHGFGLYRATEHVPLIICPVPERPLLHPRPWGITDLDPTIREWFGLPEVRDVDGASLFERGDPDRLLPALSLQSAFMFNVNPVLGIRKGNLYYMRHGVEELYDLSEDPAMLRNLARSAPHKKDLLEMRRFCNDVFPLEGLQELLFPTLESSPEELEQLQGLGYVGGLVPKLNALQRADIRDVLDHHNVLEAAKERSYQSGDWEHLVRAYRSFLKLYPTASNIYKNFGKHLVRLQRLDEARPVLEAAIRLNPEDADSLLNLGTLLLKKGEPGKARILLEKSVELAPEDPIVWKNLGILYDDYLGEPAKAIPYYRRYLELAPEGADAAGLREYLDRVAPEGGRPSDP